MKLLNVVYLKEVKMEERKDFAELTLDEQANLRFLYQVGKGLKINKQTTCINGADLEFLVKLFRNRSCTTLRGVWTVLKDTYFASSQYIYIKQTISKRKNGENL